MRVLYKLFAAVIFGVSSSLQANSALHLDWIDSSVSPADNFYRYANGNWQKMNPVPPEYSVWGAIYVLDDKVQQRLHDLVLQLMKSQAKPNSIEQKVGDFFYSGMDEKTIDDLGITPLAKEFDQINAISSKKDLQKVITHLQMIGVNALFHFWSMQDFKNSKQVIGTTIQGGLGLPDRDYYLKTEDKYQKIRAAYQEHIKRMFELAGDTPAVAADAATKVMQLETELAQASLSRTEQRDPYAIYHMMTLDELAKITPAFSWSKYLTDLGIKNIHTINFAMPDFFKKMNQLIDTIPLDTWKVYLRWQTIDSFAPYLAKPFVEQNFHMTQVISGAEKLLPRWKQVIATENEALGFALGELYVQKYFPPSSKKEVTDILNNIKIALAKDIKNLAWMSPETRLAALEKLKKMQARVGYPDKWWDYSSLHIDRKSYLENIIRTNIFLNKRDLDKIGKPVDRTEWGMTPQTVNAYYDPSMNNINLPAGILQPPFFDPKAPAAVNYGSLGYVIGHEITHGFDDKGALFDGTGNLKNWWTSADMQRFNAATACISQQYSAYKIDENLAVQGHLVMGEATADLGGLTLAFHAYIHSADYKHAQTIAGFTPEQQFFLGAAHVWAANIRPEKLRDSILTDPHPPMEYRVNGSFSNMPEFQKAFNIPNQSKMVNSSQCKIW